MSKFAALLDELKGVETLAKALPADADDKGAAADGDAAGATGADDAAIKAAAADGDANSPGAEGGAGGEPMAKSLEFEVTLPDGTKVQAMDGAALLKSLQDDMGAMSTEVSQVLSGVVGLVKAQATALNGQTALIKSLQDDVARLGAGGQGRKAVLTMMDKPAGATLAKANPDEPEGMTAEDFMAKSMTALGDGRITALDVSKIESSINRGLKIPDELVSAVVGPAK